MAVLGETEREAALAGLNGWTYDAGRGGIARRFASPISAPPSPS
jgi:hypothetical protein